MPTPSSGERRQVTAVHCDLVDSVSLTTRLDPEDMLSVMDAYLGACDAAITAHGGHVVQYMGDGVLAYFGFPAAGDDDAVRAIRAGLALRDGVLALSLPAGIRLHTRTGIATGLVVTGEHQGASQRRLGIVGEAPNLAARLQAAAAPDTVLVAHGTRHIARGAFTWRNVGRLALKGFADPIEAYEVLAASEEASRFHTSRYGVSTPLAGRTQELQAIRAAWCAAQAGHGQALLLQGEPGIGKSRLMEELRHQIAGSPHAACIWYCGPEHADSVLRPVARQFAAAAQLPAAGTPTERRDAFQAFLSRTGIEDPDATAALADLLAIHPGPPVLPPRSKETLLGTLLHLIDALAAGRPALLVLEDAHWADATTVEFVDRILQALPDRPWLLLLTARPGYAGPARRAVTTINLSRLGPAEAAEICASLGAEALLQPVAIRRIIERSDGVPLFIEEMTKTMLEEAARHEARDHAGEAMIPASLHDSLVARLDRLGTARQVASLGAVIGRRFAYPLLARVAGLPAATLRQHLRTLTLAGLIEQTGLPPHSQYTFRHALIRDAAYGLLLRPERRRIHGLIAASLQADPDPHLITEPEIIARHLTESGALERAAPHWAAAGRRAASRAAHTEAAGHLQAALAALRAPPQAGGNPHVELGLLVDLAVSLTATQGYCAPAVGRALSEARAICDTLGNAPELFIVLAGIQAFLTISGDHEAGCATARQMQAIAAATGRPEHRIHAATTIGYMLFARGELMAARANLLEAIALYSAHDGRNLPPLTPPDPLVTALGAWLHVAHALGEIEAETAASSRLESHIRALGRPFDMAWGLTWLALHAFLSEHFSRAFALADEAARLCHAHDFVLYDQVSSSIRAYAAGRIGDPGAALAQALARLPRLQALGMMHFYGFFLGETARLYAATGKRAEAAEMIEEAIGAVHRYGDWYFLRRLEAQMVELERETVLS
jgi:class 3 adenylate cyclase